ncbi:hypothetical protein IFM89_017831 [Coptis chinensis]|uniref:Oligopeptide transporter n=1 Tax=Coptis chinensis TaxID=261450 RepID=A0A835LYG3_9MAGN|nr:hypothetical protein IFM89_017831 [Coptis chinensis]
MTRAKFFMIALVCSFSWYVFPGYLFPTLTSISWVCWVFSKVSHSPSAWVGHGRPWSWGNHSRLDISIFSSDLFTSAGQNYNITAIVNDKFQIDMPKYAEQGRINISMFFALTYGFGFATIAATISHVALFFMEGSDALVGTYLACVLAFLFTPAISIITATTNQTPGLNIITEYLMGLVQPGHPIANVCFKTYGYISMAQAVSFLSDFKLGPLHEDPTTINVLVQIIGTMIAGNSYILVAWWLLTTIPNICQHELLPPNSPWTCPGDRVFFDASVLWGLVGPKRIFGSLGNYGAL